MRVETNNRHGLDFMVYDVPLRTGPGRRSCIATFFTSLHRAAPEISKGVITRGERVIAITLSEIYGAVVGESFEQGLDAPFGVVGWALRTAVEEDVKLNAQTTDVFFQPRQFLVSSRRVLAAGEFVLRLNL